MKNKLLFFFCLSFFLIGCDKEDGFVNPPIDPSEETVNRTLLVYLARDDQFLTHSGEDKITSILEGWDGVSGNILFYEDKGDDEIYLMEAYRDGENNKTRILATYEQENSASTEVFGRVLSDLKNRYPTSSYGLIFFSHATGWLPKGTYNKMESRSIGRDKGVDEMELVDFAATIPDNMFDFIIFEACFMASIEVAYELRNKTPYILASSAEIVSPGFREIYKLDEFNGLFKKEPQLIPFAEKVFEWQRDRNFNSATFSVIKTSELEALGKWLREHMELSLFNEDDINNIQHFETLKYRRFFDFEDYFSNLVLESKKEELSSLFGNCILYKAATDAFLLRYGGFVIKKHSGMTTYIIQDRYDLINAEYIKLKWYKDVFQFQ